MQGPELQPHERGREREERETEAKIDSEEGREEASEKAGRGSTIMTLQEPQLLRKVKRSLKPCLATPATAPSSLKGNRHSRLWAGDQMRG